MKIESRDIRALALIFALPAFLAAIFPYCALKCEWKSERKSPTCKLFFVELTDEMARERIAAARATWLAEASSAAQRLRPDLTAVELPEMPRTRVLTAAGRALPPPMPLVKPDYSPFRPSLAAPSPERIAAEPAVVAPAFSRDELLKPFNSTTP